jgi:hypothetical protein
MPKYDPKSSSVYFRYLPNYDKFVLLVVMNLLVTINSLFRNKEAQR